MTKSYMQQMFDTSHLSGSSAGYVDNLYEAYLADPTSIPREWRDFFGSLVEKEGTKDYSHSEIRQYFLEQAKSPSATHAAVTAAAPNHLIQEKKQAHVLQLINAYRSHGHHQAKLDPLEMAERISVPDLELQNHQLTSQDLTMIFSTESPLTNNGDTLENIFKALQQTYADTLGIEYMHITDAEQVKWIQYRVESVHSHPDFTTEEKMRILQQLVSAEGLEKYLGSRYVGQKRFSLEGGESLIPLLHEVIHRAGNQGVKEVVIGMAHRGRLNVLVNVLGKSPAELFEEFEGKKRTETSGDVKYHLGFSSDVKTEKGSRLHLALAFNPSHLEIIGPVVEGSVRARQRRRDDLVDKKQVIPVLIHGDAAFAGQGVVMETLNFSQARGYSTGGTVHIVINNQIGFTTSNPLDARSTLYCTDVAKMVQAPILHVNADDPEMVFFAAQVAFDFRMKFKKDVVIDLVCYRRHGHNEADEPSVTQPAMYRNIKQLASTRTKYAERLIAENTLTKDEADAMVYNCRDVLERGEHVVETLPANHEDEFTVDWAKYLKDDWDTPGKTAVSAKIVKEIAQKMDVLPDGFSLHPIVKRILGERVKMARGEVPIDWGFAEVMAYATLLDEGYPVRLSGQDSGRGTFAHRHAVLHDYQTAELFIPLQQIANKRDQMVVIDSILSEEAVVAFEYGYAAAEPNVFVIWEAQFGDFANGAQVVIDQFISSGEQKWGRLCGLVMLLPHGYEGQGPEHSSARLERYMQLCAQHNMQVCVPTTPAQVFHMLRRQMIRQYRKPLIVMTPKSLLRHKLAVSSLQDLAKGEFELIIPEVDDITLRKTRKVVLCSGKVYYDLLEQRRKNKQNDVAIIRVEQLYPFPKEQLKVELSRYKKAKHVVWCQEEPQNQGAWFPSRHNMQAALAKGQTLEYVGRQFFAAPAVGSAGLHLEQQRQLVDEALS